MDPSNTFVVYSGNLTLITQGLPNQSDLILGRGWIIANTSVQGVPDGNQILANVDVSIQAAGGPPTFAMNGEFGDAPPPVTGGPVKAYSVATNGQTC